jgi:nucleoside diphosphate kinase
MSVCFILLKPDVFLRNLVKEVLEWINKEEFLILAYKIGSVNDHHYEVMCSHTFYWQADEWDHNRKAFTFGPSIGLLLLGTASKDPLSYLQKMKGSALPAKREPHTIRYLFGSKSRIFNILHVPDSRENILSEARSWFGNKKVDLLLDKLRMGTQEIIPINQIISEEELHAYQSESFVEPEYSFIKMKQRLISSVLNRMDALDPILGKSLKEMQLLYSNWAQEILLEKDHLLGVEGCRLRNWEESEAEKISKLLNQLKKHSLFEYHVYFENILNLFYLFANKVTSSTQIGYLFFLLDKWNVFTSPMEKYLIESRLKYG